MTWVLLVNVVAAGAAVWLVHRNLARYGRLYWHLRSKAKLSRQVEGLGEQLDQARRAYSVLERQYASLRDEHKGCSRGA